MSSAPGPSVTTAPTKSPAARSTAPTSTGGPAPRRDSAQPPRPRPDPVDRHQQGGGAAGREGGGHRRRSSRIGRSNRGSWRRGTTPLSYIRGKCAGHAARCSTKATPWPRSPPTSPHIAEEAAALIEVEYEPLPCVLTAPDAMREGAPDARTTTCAPRSSERKRTASATSRSTSGTSSAISSKGFAAGRRHRRARIQHGHRSSGLHRTAQRHGPVEQRRARTDLVQHAGLLSRSATPPPASGPAGLAGQGHADGDRRRIRRQDSGVPGTGGGPAVEEDRPAGEDHDVAQDVFEGTGPTPGSYIKVKIGRAKTAASRPPRPIWPTRPGPIPVARSGPAAMCVFAAYDIPNVLIDGYDVVVNKPSTAAYRAPGATNAAFATETVVDEIAEKLEHRSARVPAQERRQGRNPPRRRSQVSAASADRGARGHAKNHPHYTAPLDGPNRGRGVAIGFWFNVGLQVELHGQRQCRRHREPGRRLDRHRRHAHLDRHAGRRSAGHLAPRTSGPPSSTPTRSATRTSPAAAA